MPEKFGIDAALCVLLVAGPAAGVTVCPKPGVATAAANVPHKRKSRRHALMISSPSWFARPHPGPIPPDQTALPAKVGHELSTFILDHNGAFRALESGLGVFIAERRGFLVVRFGGA